MNKKDKASNKNSEIYKRIEIGNNHKTQSRKMKEEIGSMEEMEDTTKYGEFVSSYFAWLTLEGQKRRAKYMEDMTKGKK